MATPALATGRKARVLLAHDRPVVRDALAAALAKDENDLAVSTCGAAVDATLSTIERLRPDVVVLPAPDPETLQQIHVLTRSFTGIRVIVCGLEEHPQQVLDVLEAGAVGYVAADASVGDLRDAIHLAIAGGVRLPPATAAAVVARLAALASERRAEGRARDAKLTPRGIEILRLAADGLTNKEIACRLNVEEQTVKNHVHNILERLSLRRRQEAVQYAWERGLLRTRTLPPPGPRRGTEKQ